MAPILSGSQGSGGERHDPDDVGTPAGLGALAARLRAEERRELLEHDGAARERIRADAAGLRGQVEAAAARALADGHPLERVSAAMAASSDDRARFEAMGRLAATCARIAEVEEVLTDEAHALGGEMPVGRTTELRRAHSRARFDLHAATRGAVLRGVSPTSIIEIASGAGLELEVGDLVLAFESREKGGG